MAAMIAAALAGSPSATKKTELTGGPPPNGSVVTKTTWPFAMLSHSAVAASFPRSFESIPANLQCSNNRAHIKADPPWSCIDSAQTPTE
jgi:hypothetical protein